MKYDEEIKPGVASEETAVTGMAGNPDTLVTVRTRAKQARLEPIQQLPGRQWEDRRPPGGIGR
jgi:hypothetical protein